MNLRQRFAELIEIITKDIPEREYYVQLGFLTALIQDPQDFERIQGRKDFKAR